MTDENQEEIESSAPAVSKRTNMTEADKKWGKPVMDLGFCIVPSLLLQQQHALKLKAQDLVVLLQIADHWWHADARPFPGKAELAMRLGITERQVQRIIAGLEKAGLVKREVRRNKYQARMSNYYNLDGLVQKLRELELQDRELKAAAQEAKAQLLANKKKAVKPSVAKSKAA